MSKHLYDQNPYLQTFTATVVERITIDEQPAVILDQTAFYPTSGGQPHDQGTLNDQAVVDVRALENGRIAHLMAGPLPQNDIAGRINWARRFDFMQQHSGQHILSQALAQTLNAETTSFHLGTELSTIDLNRAPLTFAQIDRAVHAANQIVFEDRPIIARFVEKSQLAAIPLRKPPTVSGPIRIVEVADFDWSPCGGTHVKRSGEVGIIQALRIERRKKQTRLHFVCGWRALADAERKRDIVQALSAHLTTSESELLASIEKTERDLKAARKKLVAAQKQLVEHQLDGWLAQAAQVGEMTVVKLAFPDYDPRIVQEIAGRLSERPQTVALLAAEQPRVQLVFARAQDVAIDAGALMRATCLQAGGRGGGRPHLAQGSIPQGRPAQEALDWAYHHLLEHSMSENA